MPITYSTDIAREIKVYIEDGRSRKRHVGTIRHYFDGWHYKPKGAKFLGQAFRTLEECKSSIDAH